MPSGLAASFVSRQPVSTLPCGSAAAIATRQPVVAAAEVVTLVGEAEHGELTWRGLVAEQPEKVEGGLLAAVAAVLDDVGDVEELSHRRRMPAGHTGLDPVVDGQLRQGHSARGRAVPRHRPGEGLSGRRRPPGARPGSPSSPARRGSSRRRTSTWVGRPSALPARDRRAGCRIAWRGPGWSCGRCRRARRPTHDTCPEAQVGRVQVHPAADAGVRLVDRAADARVLQAQGGREAGDARSDNGDPGRADRGGRRLRRAGERRQLAGRGGTGEGARTEKQVTTADAARAVGPGAGSRGLAPVLGGEPGEHARRGGCGPCRAPLVGIRRSHSRCQSSYYPRHPPVA